MEKKVIGTDSGMAMNKVGSLDMLYLGFDGGAGDNKGTIKYVKTGQVISSKSSSVVAYAPMEATDMPLFEKQRYYVGEEALYTDADKQIDITGYQPLELTSPLSLYAFLKRNNIDQAQIAHLSIGLSFAHIAHTKSFLKRMTKFKINDEVFDFTGRISLVPQGVGAKYTIEEMYKSLPTAYLIIDIGFLTRDDVDVINGIVRPENVSAEENGGVIRVARNIQEYIMKTFGEDISIKEAKEVLDGKKYFTSGEDHDLTKVIVPMLKDFTKYVMAQVEKKHAREFRKYRKIFFVGGGAHYIVPDRESIEVIKNPEYANSIGDCIKAELDFKAKSE